MTDKNKLTAKQEAFVKAIQTGKTKSDAYRLAYNTSNMTEKTVNECASFEASKPKISARLSEVTSNVREQTEYGIKEHIAELDR